MENLFLFIIGAIYGVTGMLTFSLYKEVKEMKSVFEQLLSQTENDDDETHTFM